MFLKDLNSAADVQANLAIHLKSKNLQFLMTVLKSARLISKKMIEGNERRILSRGVLGD